MNLAVYGLVAWLIIIPIIILKQGLSRKVELLSMRNLYLLSFCVYQLLSPALALKTDNFWFFPIDTPAKTGKIFLGMASVYLILFFFSYHKIKLTSWLARKLTGPPRELNDQLLIALASSLVAIAVPLRFMPVAVIAKPSIAIAIALVGIACAISGWVWSKNRGNISTNVIVGVIVACSIVLSISSTYGRRPLIGAVLGFIWGAYYRRTWWVSPARMVRFMIPLAVAAAVAVSAFTAIRGAARGGTTAQTLQHMKNANIQAGAADILGGQSTGSASLWTIENWPSRLETRKLHSAKYMILWYIPRIMWPEKPKPLGNDIATLAKIEGVRKESITLPPGVLGYARAEGGTLALIVYALFFGQFMRFFDELVRLNPTNVYIILPAGCCIGQVVGMARGCIALFSNLMIVSFIATFFILYIVNKLFGDRVKDAYITMAWPQYR
jgi:hypothetical protein